MTWLDLNYIAVTLLWSLYTEDLRNTIWSNRYKVFIIKPLFMISVVVQMCDAFGIVRCCFWILTATFYDGFVIASGDGVLQVLETCVKNCGRRFHIFVAQKEFLQELVKLAMPRNNPPHFVLDKVLGLIQVWSYWM